MKWLLLAALLAAPGLAHAQAIELVCRGTALHTEAKQSFGSVSGDVDLQGSSTTYSKERSAEFLRIRLDGNGAGQLKMPASLIPPISRGKDGWWDFVKLETSDNAIRGQISLNVMNRPTVLIDRHTGDIDMKGLGMRFQGSCEKAPDSSAERRF